MLVIEVEEVEIDLNRRGLHTGGKAFYVSRGPSRRLGN